MQKIKINDKEYKIAFNFGVIKNICSKNKITTPELIQKLSMGDLEIISDTLYFGIKFFDEDFDIKEIESMSIQNVFECFNTIGSLMNTSLPQDNKPKKTATKKK